MNLPPGEAAPAAWADALLAADLLALDPISLGGAVVHGAPGPARDAWLARVSVGMASGAPMLQIPLRVSTDRLLGGLDIAATVGVRRRVVAQGVLERADTGIAILAMAERWGISEAALIASVLDRREILIERDGITARRCAQFGLIALDESAGDEPGPPASLTDRLAFHISFDAIGLEALSNEPAGRGALTDARERHAGMPAAPTTIVRALCQAASELGIVSLRAQMFAVAVARAHAALSGRTVVDVEDAAAAARLVLAPRATRAPAQADGAEARPEPPQDQTPAGDDGVSDLQDSTSDPTAADIVLAAARTALPARLLENIALHEQGRQRASGDGKAGALRKSTSRGRVTGVQPATTEPRARLNVLATLRAAAPWQRLRRPPIRSEDSVPACVLIRKEDFRVNRHKHHSASTIVFAVDASGSSALHRLTEAKGAVELLLAECYARRDSVALVAFRGTAAEVRLPPTRSLTRAKRSLAGLPGGGGTPLAAGIDASTEIALRARRKGDTPLVVFLTDGRANVTRDGKAGRANAEQHALSAARLMQNHRIASVLLDTSPQPNPFARRLAAEMGGRYVPLPVAGAEAISTAVQQGLVSSRP